MLDLRTRVLATCHVYCFNLPMSSILFLSYTRSISRVQSAVIYVRAIVKQDNTVVILESLIEGGRWEGGVRC